MAKEKLGLEELRDIYESLKEFSECAVCLHPLRPDTVLCVNGHVICEVCKGSQPTCPTCRKEFSNLETPVFIRKVLGLLPHTCKYEGCGEIVRIYDDHEMYCSMRPINCKDCKWRGPVNELEEHWNLHPCKAVSSSLINIHKNFSIDKHHGHSFSLLKMGNLFWVEHNYNADSGVMSCSIDPILEEKPKHGALLLKLTFESVKKQYSFGVKVELEHSEQDDNKVYVPVAVLKHFVSAGELKYEICVSNQG